MVRQTGIFLLGLMVSSFACAISPHWDEANIFDVENTLGLEVSKLRKRGLTDLQLEELRSQNRVFMANDREWVLADGAQEIIEAQWKKGNIFLGLHSDNKALREDAFKNMRFRDGRPMSPAFSDPRGGPPHVFVRDPQEIFTAAKLEKLVRPDRVFIFDDNPVYRRAANEANFILIPNAEVLEGDLLNTNYLKQAYGMRTRALELAVLKGTNPTDELWKLQWGDAPRGRDAHFPQLDFDNARSREAVRNLQSASRGLRGREYSRGLNCDYSLLVPSPEDNKVEP